MVDTKCEDGAVIQVEHGMLDTSQLFPSSVGYKAGPADDVMLVNLANADLVLADLCGGHDLE
jgi:hypothetical protein